MVELVRLPDGQVVLGVLVEAHAREVVVPRARRGRWHHEEAEETVRQHQLHALIVRRQVALRVRALVGVRAAPLVASGSQSVGRERRRAGREAARDDDAAFGVERRVLREEARVRCHVRGAQLRQLVRLRVQPAEWLEILQVLVRRQCGRQLDCLMGAHLRRQHQTAHFLNARVVTRRNAIDERPDLRSTNT